MIVKRSMYRATISNLQQATPLCLGEIALQDKLTINDINLLRRVFATLTIMKVIPAVLQFDHDVIER